MSEAPKALDSRSEMEPRLAVEVRSLWNQTVLFAARLPSALGSVLRTQYSRSQHETEKGAFQTARLRSMLERGCGCTPS